jgi:hypothetical protein
MNRILIISFIFLFIPNSFADSRIPEYNIKANLDINRHIIYGEEGVVYANNSSSVLKNIYFNIYANKYYTPEEIRRAQFAFNFFRSKFMPEGFNKNYLKIKEIKKGNTPVKFNIEGKYKTILKVELPSALAPGEKVTLNIKFEVKIPPAMGIFGYHKSVTYLSYWYPMLAVFKDGQWHTNPLSVYHQPYFMETSNYKLSLTLAANQRVAHSGIKTGAKHHKSNLKTIYIEAPLVRDMTLAISSEYNLLSRKCGNVTIKSYYLNESKDFAEKSLDYAVSAMKYYQKTLGKYPYPEFSVAETHIGWLGNEFSNIIFIDNRAYNLPGILERHFDFLISHEMAHQWFLIQVGSNQYRQTWLDEAFAAYIGLLYLEDKYGTGNNYYKLPKKLTFLPEASFRESRRIRYLYLVKNNIDEIILKPIDKFKRPENVFVMPYDKGLFVLDMFKHLVGEEKFFLILRTYIKRYQYKTAQVKDFIEVCNEISGRDFTGFFNDWLKTDKVCDYGIGGVGGRKKRARYHYSIRFIRKGEIRMPVEILIRFKDGYKETIKWDGHDREKTIVVSHKYKLDLVYVDPDKKLLDVDLKNNYWPSNIKLKTTPYYAGIYDVPMLNPTDRYAMVLGIPLNVYNAGIRLSGAHMLDDFSYLDVRYDFHHKLVLAKAEHRVDHVGKIREGSLKFTSYVKDSVDSDEWLKGIKVSFKKELGYKIYALEPIENDISFYIERNHELTERFGKKNRTIAGVTYNRDTKILAWDPIGGTKTILNIGRVHDIFGGSEEYNFFKGDFRIYKNLWEEKYILALRGVVGLSNPGARDLFTLGGMDTLRGYGDLAFEGSNMVLGNAEFRFPIFSGKEHPLLYKILNFNKLSGVLFYDKGKLWEEHFKDSPYRDNIGFGLRMEVTALGFFEKLIITTDFAVPTDDTSKLRIWLQMGHAF